MNVSMADIPFLAPSVSSGFNLSWPSRYGPCVELWSPLFDGELRANISV